MSWLGKLLGKGKGYNQFKDEELEELDVGAVALDAAIEAAEITAQSGKISDQIALLELLLKKKPGNISYIRNLKDLKATAAVLAASAAAAATANIEEENYESGSEGSVAGSEGSVEGSVGSAFSNEGGKKSRYSRKLKSKYSRKSKSKYSRKSKSKYSRKY